MKRNLTFILIIVMIIASISMASASIVYAEEQEDNEPSFSKSKTTYSVTANGQVTADADYALINIGIDGLYDNLKEGEQENLRIYNNLISAFKKYGTVSQEYYSIYPDNINKKYNISRSINCTTDKIKDINKIIAELTNAGANRFFGISYQVKDVNQYKKMALAKAKEVAIDKATAFNGNLKLIDIKELSCFIDCNNSNIVKDNQYKVIIQATVQATFIEK